MAAQYEDADGFIWVLNGGGYAVRLGSEGGDQDCEDGEAFEAEIGGGRGEDGRC